MQVSLLQLLIFVSAFAAWRFVGASTPQKLGAGNVVAALPLLDVHLVKDGRFSGNETAPGTIIPTQVKIFDLAAPENSEFASWLSMPTNGFEVGVLDASIALPDPSAHHTRAPYTPWASHERPLASFVRQFAYRLTPPVTLPHSLVLTLTCHGELLRGATAEGAAAHGPVQWPPTFNAHVDQDIRGEPLASLGYAWVFQWLPLHLVNLWIPLNSGQARPLALLDTSQLGDADFPDGSARPILARWSQTTFNITSDRFIVTTEASGGRAASGLWWFHSQLAPGHALVFSTDKAPHTSFGRPEFLASADAVLAGGVRYSVEMRCLSLVVPKARAGAGVVVGTAVALLLTGWWRWCKR